MYSSKTDLFSQDGGATWPSVPLRTRVRGADWLITKDAPNTIVSFEQKDKTTPNWAFSEDRSSELVLSKDYFQSSEVIGRDIVGYYMKDQHMFTAKVFWFFFFCSLLFFSFEFFLTHNVD